jgi:hypothetical protein
MDDSKVVKIKLNGGPETTFGMDGSLKDIGQPRTNLAYTTLGIVKSVATQVDDAAKDYQQKTGKQLHYIVFLDNLAARSTQ